MKNFILLFLFAAFTLPLSATIHTVSKNPALPAQFEEIEDAIQAASAGDTIYVYPTTVVWAYGIVTIDKPVILFGGGALGGGTGHAPTILGGIKINSDNVTVSGFKLYGLQTGSVEQPVNNIAITDCAIHRSGLSGENGAPIYLDLQIYGNNLLFENCLLQDGSIYELEILNKHPSGIVVRGCLFFDISLKIKGIPELIVENNVFIGTQSSKNAFMIQGQYGENSSWGSSVAIRNNIFYKLNPVYTDGTNSTAGAAYQNNIAYLTTGAIPNYGLSSGNLNETDPFFENVPADGTDAFYLAHSYQLQNTSPGKNAGTDGTDIGVWGGLSPLNKFFEAPLPRVTKIKLSNHTTPPGTQVELTIQATKAQ